MTIPRVLRDTIKEKYIYEALRNSGFLTTKLAEYIDGIRCETASITKELDYLPAKVRADIAWVGALEAAHNTWRSQTAVRELMLDEACANCLFAFTRLELAGPRMFNIWAGYFFKLFSSVWPDLDSPFELEGYSQQMNQMEEINFSHSQFLSNTFIVNRRRFAEEASIAGKGDLYRFISNSHNDILGTVCDTTNDVEARKIISKINGKMYRDENGFAYRLTRQIIQENGGVAPVEW